MMDREKLAGIVRLLRSDAQRSTMGSGLVDAVLARLDEPATKEDRAALREDAPMTVEELLSAEHVETIESADLDGLATAVRARLEADERTRSSEESWVLAPDVEPDLEGRSAAEWMRAEHADVLETPPRPWAEMTEAVLGRIARAPVAEPMDVLAPDRTPSVTVAELLQAERDAALDQMAGRWVAFSAQVVARLRDEAVRPGEASDEQAVALLRADVEEELRDLSPAFEERFRDEVDRRIFQRGRSSDSVWVRARRWWHEQKSKGGLGWGLGLAGAVAAVFLVVQVGSEPGPGSMGGPRAELTGEVSVDSVSFEGDVMMIPDDGMTVVVLSGV